MELHILLQVNLILVQLIKTREMISFMLTKFTLWAIKSFCTLTFILLYTFTAIQTLWFTDACREKKIVQQNKIISKRMYNNIYTSFTMSSLIASWTRTNCWCRAKTTIHAFWIAECSLTIWSHVADWTLTNLFLTTPSTVCTFFTTFRIGCFISNDGEKNMN